MANKNGSRQRILEFLLANIGRIIDGEEIREASGNVSEWARRVRELRDEEGEISTIPGEVILLVLKRNVCCEYL